MKTVDGCVEQENTKEVGVHLVSGTEIAPPVLLLNHYSVFAFLFIVRKWTL